MTDKKLMEAARARELALRWRASGLDDGQLVKLEADFSEALRHAARRERGELGKLRQQLNELVTSSERLLSVLDGSENPDG